MYGVVVHHPKDAFQYSPSKVFQYKTEQDAIKAIKLLVQPTKTELEWFLNGKQPITSSNGEVQVIDLIAPKSSDLSIKRVRLEG